MFSKPSLTVHLAIQNIQPKLRNLEHLSIFLETSLKVSFTVLQRLPRVMNIIDNHQKHAFVPRILMNHDYPARWSGVGTAERWLEVW